MKRSTQTFLFLLSFTLVFTTVFFGYRWIRHARLVRSVGAVVRIPFTVYQHATVTAANTKFASGPTVRTMSILARQPDGSEAYQTDTVFNGFKTRTIIIGNVKRVTYDEAGVVISRQYSPEELAKVERNVGGVFDPGNGCLTTIRGTTPARTLESSDTLLGVPALKIRSANGIVGTYAPTLNCLPLEHRAQWSNGSLSELIVDKVVVGTAEPALFEVPSHYREMKPSDAMRERLVFSKNIPPDRFDKIITGEAAYDDFYSRHRPSQ